MAHIILFDGLCNFCNSAVQFILKRDPYGQFNFASLQSEIGQELLRKHGIGADTDSFILIEDYGYYVKSSAALRVCHHLEGPWRLLSVFRIVPRPVRDVVYDFVARNRYKWFGKRDSCIRPSAEIMGRFLDTRR